MVLHHQKGRLEGTLAQMSAALKGTCSHFYKGETLVGPSETRGRVERGHPAPSSAVLESEPSKRSVKYIDGPLRSGLIEMQLGERRRISRGEAHIQAERADVGHCSCL